MTARAHIWIALAACLSVPATGHAQMDGSEHVKVSVYEPFLPSGELGTYLVRVTFALDPEWHIYWKNPGDSGAPPSFGWKLPEGFEVVGTRWEAPHRIIAGGIASYGYEGIVNIGVAIKPPKGFKIGDKVPFSLEANYLVCKDLCLPGSATVRGELFIPLPTTGSIGINLPYPGKPESAKFTSDKDTVTLTFDVQQLAGWTVANAYFFPATEATLDHAAEQKWKLDGTKLTLTVKSSKYATKPFNSVDGVLVINMINEHDKKLKLAIEYNKTNPQEKQE